MTAKKLIDPNAGHVRKRQGAAAEMQKVLIARTLLAWSHGGASRSRRKKTHSPWIYSKDKGNSAADFICIIRTKLQYKQKQIQFRVLGLIRGLNGPLNQSSPKITITSIFLHSPSFADFKTNTTTFPFF